MLLINIRVPEGHENAAQVDLKEAMSLRMHGLAAASVSRALAAKRGNPACDPMRPWGHPPPGVYQMIAHGPAPAGCEIEYGEHLLAFQPLKGRALDAESYGRLVLLAYAGPVGGGGALRCTQGGIRLQQSLMDYIVSRISKPTEVVMQIAIEGPPAWWQFWRTADRAAPLAPEAPRFDAPPLDEATLAAALSEGKRLPHRTPMQQDDTDWRDRESSSSSSGTSSSDRPYSGGGGTYGGAGASGSWGNAPAGRGVDAAGRISAAAAAAVGVAALDAASRDTGTDTSTTTNY